MIKKFLRLDYRRSRPLFPSFITRVERIFFDKTSKSAKKALLLEKHSQTYEQKRASMLWLRKGYREKMDELEPHQWINHFPNEAAIINKGYLTETLAKYDSSRSENCLAMSQFYPESYRLYDPEERKAFLSQLPLKDRPDNLWIYKPGNNSRGRGIEIMWNFGALRRKYGKLGDRFITNKNEQGIIQRYIKKPLLLEGRKSEIRVYWLVANLDPLMVLLYPEATVRLNSLPYKLDDFDNQLVHVTNVFQQKNHPDYDPDQVLKWKFEKLGKYLSGDLGIVDPDFLQANLIPRIRQILATVSHASRDQLKAQLPEQGNCFAVFGADLIIDENLNPWLSEVQKGPGLSFDDPVKKDVIPPMLGEAARIVLEMRKRRIQGRLFSKLKSVKNYQWVVNELEPNQVQYPDSKCNFIDPRKPIESEVVLPA